MCVCLDPQRATYLYRVGLVVWQLVWVDSDLGSSPRLVGRYCSYLLSKQDVGTFQI